MHSVWHHFQCPVVLKYNISSSHRPRAGGEATCSPVRVGIGQPHVTLCRSSWPLAFSVQKLLEQDPGGDQSSEEPRCELQDVKYVAFFPWITLLLGPFWLSLYFFVFSFWLPVLSHSHFPLNHSLPILAPLFCRSLLPSGGASSWWERLLWGRVRGSTASSSPGSLWEAGTHLHSAAWFQVGSHSGQIALIGALVLTTIWWLVLTHCLTLRVKWQVLKYIMRIKRPPPPYRISKRGYSWHRRVKLITSFRHESW